MTSNGRAGSSPARGTINNLKMDSYIKLGFTKDQNEHDANRYYNTAGFAFIVDKEDPTDIYIECIYDNREQYVHSVEDVKSEYIKFLRYQINRCDYNVSFFKKRKKFFKEHYSQIK